MRQYIARNICLIFYSNASLCNTVYITVDVTILRALCNYPRDVIKCTNITDRISNNFFRENEKARKESKKLTF